MKKSNKTESGKIFNLRSVTDTFIYKWKWIPENKRVHLVARELQDITQEEPGCDNYDDQVVTYVYNVVGLRHVPYVVCDYVV